MPARTIEVKITGTDRSGPALRSATEGFAHLGQQAERTQGVLSRIGSGFSSFAGGLTRALGQIGLAGMGLQALAGAAQGLGNALGVGLQMEMEDVQAQFLAFTKSADKTADILAQVREEANKTPFAFKEMAAAAAGLMPAAKQAGVGLMDLIKQAEILAASNPAEGLQGAAFSLREAVSGDFTSIIERFNLPRSYINKLKEEGVPALEIVRRAMLEMGYDASLVANKAKTLSGRWSTFNDTLDTLKMTLSEPIFAFLSQGLSDLQGYLDTNMDALQAWARNVADGFRSAINWVGKLATGVRDFLGYLGAGNRRDLMREWFGDWGPAIDEAVRGLKTLIGSVSTLASLITSGNWASAGNLLRDVFANLGEKLAPLAGRLTSWLAQQFALIDWNAVWASVRDVGSFILTAGWSIVSELGNWLGRQFAAVDWASVWANVRGVAAAIGTAAWNVAVALTNWLAGQFGQIDWNMVWTGAAGLAQGIGTAAWTVAVQLTGWLRDQFAQIDWNVVWSGVVGVTTSLKDKFVGLGQQAQGWIGAELAAVDWKQLRQDLEPYSYAMSGLAAAAAAAATAFLLARGEMLAYNAILTISRGVLWAVTAAQTALNVAMTANPIGVVIVAIAAMAAGLFTLYQTNETFRQSVDNAWASISTFGQGLVDTVSTTGAAWNGWCDEALEKFDAFIASVANVFGGDVWGALWNGAMKPVNDLVGALRSLWEWGGKALETLRSLTGQQSLYRNMLPEPGLAAPSVTSVPTFASGGIVPGPLGAAQLAVVHGGEEVVAAGRRAGTTLNLGGISLVIQGNADGPTVQRAARAGVLEGLRAAGVL